MILKNRFFTQSAPDIRHKLLKQAYGPNQSLDTLLQLAKSIMVGNMKKSKKGKKKTHTHTHKETGGSPPTAMGTVLKQPEKNAQRDPGEKGWACHYCRKEGHLKWDCPQASKLSPGSMSGLQRTRRETQWKRDCPQRCRFQGSDSQDNQD